MKLSQNFKMEEGEQPVRVLHTSPGLRISDTRLAEHGIEITGVITIGILYENSGEETRFGCRKVSIPFTHVMETQETEKSSVFPLKADVEQLTVSVIDGDEIDVKCILFFSANLYREWKEKIVEEVITTELDSEKIDSLPSLAVYVVREGESLWDIGKRYYVPISSIRQTNELTSDEVKAGDKILIMR